MKITIITSGKTNLDYAKIGVQKYLKQITKFSKIKHIELKEKSFENKVLAYKDNSSYLIALDESGQHFTSRDFATFIKSVEVKNIKNLYFIIGPADGFGKDFLGKVNYTMSLSNLTFAHDLALLVFCETLYRSLSIKAGHPYHRD